jgi:ABC-type nickel/cobalt efflux system permease component RcnA
MTPAGWVFMLCSLGLVIGVTVFCFYRVLVKPKTAEHMHAPRDIDTHDRET